MPGIKEIRDFDGWFSQGDSFVEQVKDFFNSCLAVGINYEIKKYNNFPPRNYVKERGFEIKVADSYFEAIVEATEKVILIEADKLLIKRYEIALSVEIPRYEHHNIEIYFNYSEGVGEVRVFNNFKKIKKEAIVSAEMFEKLGEVFDEIYGKVAKIYLSSSV